MAIAGGSPLGELIERIAPGAGETLVADIFRTATKIVVLTQAQYDALTVKDSSTLYLVTV